MLGEQVFQRGIARLAAAFSAEVNAAKLAVYWDELCDLTDATFEAAVRRALREWSQPYALPPIAVLRAFAGEARSVAAAASGAVVDGETAWAYLAREVLARYRPLVANQTIAWPDDGGLARTIIREDLGGIHEVATAEGEIARDQLRRRFIAAYDRARRSGEVLALIPGGRAS